MKETNKKYMYQLFRTCITVNVNGALSSEESLPSLNGVSAQTFLNSKKTQRL